MTPQLEKLTAFVCHNGAFQFIRKPFGLCNAGATFQRAMENILNNIDNSMAYIDDVVTFSYDFNGHLAVEKVFKVSKKSQNKT